jgi:hypothetical protein
MQTGFVPRPLAGSASYNFDYSSPVGIGGSPSISGFSITDPMELRRVVFGENPDVVPSRALSCTICSFHAANGNVADKYSEGCSSARDVLAGIRPELGTQ